MPQFVTIQVHISELVGYEYLFRSDDCIWLQFALCGCEEDCDNWSEWFHSTTQSGYTFHLHLWLWYPPTAWDETVYVRLPPLAQRSWYLPWARFCAECTIRRLCSREIMKLAIRKLSSGSEYWSCGVADHQIYRAKLISISIPSAPQAPWVLTASMYQDHYLLVHWSQILSCSCWESMMQNHLVRVVVALICVLYTVLANG